MDTYITDLLHDIDAYRESHSALIQGTKNEEYLNFYRKKISESLDLNPHLINWENVVKSFNSVLQQEREHKLKLSQVELAYLLNVSPFTVSSWESKGKSKVTDLKNDSDEISQASVKQRRRAVNQNLWRIGRRLPSMEQGYILANVTDVGLNHYFLDASLENRINAYNRLIFLLSLIEQEQVANKETFFKEIAPVIEAMLEEEKKDIIANNSILEKSHIAYEPSHQEEGLDIFTSASLDGMEDEFNTQILCFLLKVFTNETLVAIYNRMEDHKVGFYFKKTFKILLREHNHEPYTGIDYRTSITRFFSFIEKEDYQATCTEEDFIIFENYFRNRCDFLQACDILHFESIMRTRFIEGPVQRYSKLKELYGSQEVQELDYGKREFLNKLGVQYTQDNLDETYQKAIELLSPIAKNMVFKKEE